MYRCVRRRDEDRALILDEDAASMIKLLQRKRVSAYVRMRRLLPRPPRILSSPSKLILPETSQGQPSCSAISLQPQSKKRKRRIRSRVASKTPACWWPRAGAGQAVLWCGRRWWVERCTQRAGFLPNRSDGYGDAQGFFRERQARSAVVVFETANLRRVSLQGLRS
jgi:hypothetical protein